MPATLALMEDQVEGIRELMVARASPLGVHSWHGSASLVESKGGDKSALRSSTMDGRYAKARGRKQAMADKQSCGRKQMLGTAMGGSKLKACEWQHMAERWMSQSWQQVWADGIASVSTAM